MGTGDNDISTGTGAVEDSGRISMADARLERDKMHTQRRMAIGAFCFLIVVSTLILILIVSGRMTIEEVSSYQGFLTTIVVSFTTVIGIYMGGETYLNKL